MSVFYVPIHINALNMILSMEKDVYPKMRNSWKYIECPHGMVTQYNVKLLFNAKSCVVIDNIQMLALYKELNGRRIELIIMLQ